MKKKIYMATAVLAAVLLSGCAKESDVQRYAWPLATSSPEDTVTQLFSEKFAEEVDRLSDEKMKIQVYPNSTLGGDRELLESCKDGDIPFVVQNTAPQVTFMKDAAVFDIPCVFDSIEEVRNKVDDAKFYGLMEDVYKDAGYKLLGYADQGFRVMSTNKNVTSLSDFKGQKIDAQENPYEVIVSSRLYEQQDYVVETNHLPHLISLIVSDEFFEGLSKKEQNVITEASEIAKKYAREQSDTRIAEKIKVIEESGTKIVPMSDELRQEVRDASKGVTEEIRHSVSKDIVDAYVE